MVVVSNGSIADYVFSGISPFPLAISGVLLNTVNNQIFFVEQFTGTSIPTNSIANQFQSPITDLTLATVCKLMAIQDLGVQSVTVEGLSTNNSNLLEMAKLFETKAMAQLKSLGVSRLSYKARG